MWNFSNANLDFLLNDRTLDIKDMSAGLFGGQAAVSGQIKLDQVNAIHWA